MNDIVSAGKLRWPITIEASPENVSEYGEVTGSWTTIGTDRAEITPASGSNTEAGLPQRESVNWYTVKTRLNYDLVGGRRLLVTGSPYDGKRLYVSDSQHTLATTTARCFERLAG